MFGKLHGAQAPSSLWFYHSRHRQEIKVIIDGVYDRSRPLYKNNYSMKTKVWYLRLIRGLLWLCRPYFSIIEHWWPASVQIPLSENMHFLDLLIKYFQKRIFTKSQMQLGMARKLIYTAHPYNSSIWQFKIFENGSIFVERSPFWSSWQFFFIFVAPSNLNLCLNDLCY